MKDLAEYIIKQLVNNPDDVSIEENDSGQGEITLVASVNPEDMGIVIGKSGQTIKAIRRILSIRAMNENVRVNLQLAEPEGQGGRVKGEVESEEESESQGVTESESDDGGQKTEEASLEETPSEEAKAE